MKSKSLSLVICLALLLLIWAFGCGAGPALQQQKITKVGCDISEYQGEIRWEQLGGLDFVIIRCAVSNQKTGFREDKRFKENYEAAKQAGIQVSAYVYTQARSDVEMTNDVKAALKVLDDREVAYVFLDVESDCQRFIPDAMTEAVRTGCELLTQAGYQAGVYSYYDFAKHHLQTSKLPYLLWLARYSGSTDEQPDLFNAKLWQYTDKGQLPGIDTEVDLDVMFY